MRIIALLLIALVVFFVVCVVILVRNLFQYQKEIDTNKFLEVACAGTPKANNPESVKMPHVLASNLVSKNDAGKNRGTKRFFVKGDSMLLGGIRNGDIVCVEMYSCEDVSQLHYPTIIVLKRNEKSEESAVAINDNSKYKIRRAWGTYHFNKNDLDTSKEKVMNRVGVIYEMELFRALRNKYPEKFLDKQEMINHFEKKMSTYVDEYLLTESPKEKDFSVFISTTYDTVDEKVRFSIHSIDLLQGQVVKVYASVDISNDVA